jgi:hypothetical protein
MSTQTITNALQKLMHFSYVAFLKSNDGFEIEDERNGYESEQFTQEIQVDCGIQFLRATTERYGGDYTLHYKMVEWLAELFSAYQLPLKFTSKLRNNNGGDQAYVNRLGEVNNEINYDLDALGKLSKSDLIKICEKLELQISFLVLKY